MTAKLKAIDLINKYLPCVHPFIDHVALKQAKKCALIAVDEIIRHCAQVEPFLGVDYWIEVKSEIEKL